jgi:transposase
MTRRSELTDPQFALIEDLLPATGKPGGQWNDHRTTLDRILWILHTGAQWRERPDRYRRPKSVDDRLRRWRLDGTTDRIPERLLLRLDERSRIDHELWGVDATSIRASRSAAGARRDAKGAGEPADHALGRGRGGFGTELPLIVDGNGLPLAATLWAGQAHESRPPEPVPEAARLARPRRLAGDKAKPGPIEQPPSRSTQLDPTARHAGPLVTRSNTSRNTA